MRGLLLVWTVAVALVWSTSALAHPDIDAAREMLAKGDFRTALLRLERAELSPELKEDELADVHWYRGVIRHTMGQEDLARESFDAVLKLRPLFTPDRLETPPPLRAAFQQRAAVYQADHGIALSVAGVQGTTLFVYLQGHPEEASTLVLFVRVAGAFIYQKQELPTEGRAMVPARITDRAWWESFPADGGVMEVVLEARNLRGTPLARAGDARAPLQINVAAEERTRALTELAPPTPPPPPPDLDAAAEDDDGEVPSEDAPADAQAPTEQPAPEIPVEATPDPPVALSPLPPDVEPALEPPPPPPTFVIPEAAPRDEGNVFIWRTMAAATLVAGGVVLGLGVASVVGLVVALVSARLLFVAVDSPGSEALFNRPLMLNIYYSVLALCGVLGAAAGVAGVTGVGAVVLGAVLATRGFLL